MRAFWLLRFFGRHNTCYIRAMTLYRYLDTESERLRLHLGVERRDDPAERLRGHAWVSLDGTIWRAPKQHSRGALTRFT